MTTGKISKIAGPVVTASKMKGAKMYDVVSVGEEKLLGEIIELEQDRAIIQVYEETTGVRPGEPVESKGMPLSVELGPGLLNHIYDGIARPLKLITEQAGDFITRGVNVPTLDAKKKHDFKPAVRPGDTVIPGQILGRVQETSLIEHRVLVPPDIQGKVKSIENGDQTIEDTIAVIHTNKGDKKITMRQYWPVRKARPFQQKLAPDIPLITGQRVFDFMFPVAKGGVAAIPGPFGSGKTVSEHSLAKWCDADVVIFIGCGERGNEMSDVLQEFPELIDPKSGKPLMERTVLIANTSNMPVAAREASVYTGITMAEYYRDMGYDVSLMADSTSRWAEAMREISARLEEMPGEEGYPAYLSSRLAQFYERAGRVINLNSSKGSISVIGAVSPPGGDLSEPVTQSTLRISKVFWALDAPLAYSRHFPAINWLTSYTLYDKALAPYFNKEVASDFTKVKARTMTLLQKEAELKEIVQLVGPDVLPENEKLILETSKSIREDFLQQNAFHDVDAYCSLTKQYKMIKTILHFHDVALKALEKGTKVVDLANLPVKEKIGRMKYDQNFEDHTPSLWKQIEQEVEA
ncbi:V-type ATP synthase subunit A [archaeon]|nr:V-type ATP synthase subunit A [archaeon]